MRQLEIYEEILDIEMTNMLRLPIESVSKSGIAWTIWQCINSYDDWCAKTNNIADRDSRHTLHSRFTYTACHRSQPAHDSEGILFSRKIENGLGNSWFMQYFVTSFMDLTRGE